MRERLDPTAIPILAQRELSRHHYDANVTVNHIIAVKYIVSFLRLPYTLQIVEFNAASSFK